MIQLRFSDVLRPRFFLGVARQRMQVRAFALVGRDITVDLGDGLRVRIPARQRLVQRVLEEGFEPAESDFISRALRPGDVFVDVGAHVGIHTLVAARAVAPDGRGYAFEPNPDTFAVLERNIRANRFDAIVRCVRCAVSDSAGVAQLHVPDARYAACSSLVVPAYVVVAEDVEVATAPLDELVEGRPTLVKIDVDGWERHVIAGAHRLLAPADAPHLLVEFVDVAAAAAGTTTSALADDLEQLGYRLFRYDHRTRKLHPTPRVEGNREVNLVATKRLDELQARLAPTDA